MPSERVFNRSFNELLGTFIRFEIPFFQRGYSWTRKNWETLFSDISDYIIAELEDGTPLSEHEHFFGPIVVLEKTNSDLALKTFLVIDGQQRITTVYILLGIFSDLLDKQKHLSPDAAQYNAELSKYTRNDVPSNGDDYRKLKVFSCKGDRYPTYKTIFNDNPTSPTAAFDIQLYDSEINKIDQLKKYATRKLKADYSDVPSLWRLAQILLQCLKIVWIPLDEKKDDPQAIFESLNDKGTPLTASELLCNYIFKPLIANNADFENIHNEKWLKTIKNVGGDANFENYLRYSLSIGQNKMIGKGRRVYVFFKNKNKNVTTNSVMSFLDEMYSSAELFNNITSPSYHNHSSREICLALINLKTTNMDSSTPYLLSLLRALANQAIQEEEVVRLVNELLVLLVRRKSASLPVTRFDSFFPPLFQKIRDEEDKVGAFQNQVRNDGLWVSDQEFKHALTEQEIYSQREQPFVLMILREIDKSMQRHGQIPDYSSVGTVEHIMPQTLTEEWRTYLGEDGNDQSIDRITDTIGNLCLLSQPANSTAGQNPFESKVAGYSEVTALARELKTFSGIWNIDAIRGRSSQMAERAIQIWSWT